MKKKIAIGVVTVIVAVLIFAFALPSNVHVERSLSMKAPAATVYPLISSFESFNRWSPWFKRDPKTKYTFTGTPGQVGSKMSWTSDHPKVGNGSQEVTALEPNKSVTTHLNFGGEGDGDAKFILEEAAGNTKVTWTHDTDMGNNPVGRLFGFFAFEGMIGPDYEAGLANLKAIVEGGDAKADDAVAAPGAATPAAK